MLRKDGPNSPEHLPALYSGKSVTLPFSLGLKTGGGEEWGVEGSPLWASGSVSGQGWP